MPAQSEHIALSVPPPLPLSGLETFRAKGFVKFQYSRPVSVVVIVALCVVSGRLSGSFPPSKEAKWGKRPVVYPVRFPN